MDPEHLDLYQVETPDHTIIVRLFGNSCGIFPHLYLLQGLTTSGIRVE